MQGVRKQNTDQHAAGIGGKAISDEFLLHEHQVQSTGNDWWQCSFCCITISGRKNMLVSHCACNSRLSALLNQQCHLVSVHDCCDYISLSCDVPLAVKYANQNLFFKLKSTLYAGSCSAACVLLLDVRDCKPDCIDSSSGNRCWRHLIAS